MAAIISQVEGLGKSWENCAGIRIRLPPLPAPALNIAKEGVESWRAKAEQGGRGGQFASDI